MDKKSFSIQVSPVGTVLKSKGTDRMSCTSLYHIRR